MARFAIPGIGLYAVSVMLVSGSNFISTPLLIKAMSAAEFSRWALLEPILLALIPVAGLGINVGLMQKLATDRDRAAELFSELFPYQLASALVLGLVGFVIFLLATDASISLAATCASIIAAEGSLLFFMAFWRSQNKPAYFIAVDGVRSFALMVAIYAASLAIAAAAFSAETYLVLRLGFAVAAVAWALFLVKPSWAPSKETAVSSIKYGLPITIASFLSTWFLNIDRYAVDRFGDAVDLTTYVAHARIAQLLPMAIMAPFFLWFAPKAMRAVAEKGAALQEAANITLIYVAILLWASVNLWLLMPFAWPLIFPSVAFDPYLFSVNVVSAAIFSLANPLSIGSLGDKKTVAALVISGAGLGIALLSTFAFGAVGGLHGIAFGRAAGIVIYTVIFATFTVRTTGIRYNWQAMLGMAVAFVALALIVENLHIGAPWMAYGEQLVAANLIMAFGALLLMRINGKSWKPRLSRAREFKNG